MAISLVGVAVGYDSSLHRNLEHSLPQYHRRLQLELTMSEARRHECGESVSVYLHLLEGTVRHPATVFFRETQPRPPRVPALASGIKFQRA